MDSEALRQGLKEQGYIADDNTLMALQCSLLLNKPRSGRRRKNRTGQSLEPLWAAAPDPPAML
ncbi:hypothetical protein SAMN02745215_00303 [Desulfitobacterium chlororespirans DSM 11544]|uniref:Uncharacterized protein n=1 Tax=Desulfitobacterium chlororespirans DSM 11544 TaxID=1121395 RepID=A0A1M7RZU9_9FIRM|nr:hypothetical protein [Desulfitobacterium chlororespirans]SHN51594.1 hypothetical protein SAMN02745215_00303 [Desulfitobacterium chlororespirans DSM 11544]